MRYHEDSRRRFWGDIFVTPGYDINVVALNPGIVIAWHRHQHQDDRIFLLSGDIHIQIINEKGHRDRFKLEGRDNLPIWIQRGCWHGYGTQEGATLIQCNGPRKWDGTDEERHPIDDEMPWT